MREFWKSVVGYEGLYEVSSEGRVRSLAREIQSRNRWGPVTMRWPSKDLCLLKTQSGYLKVLLSKQGKAVNKLVATLVAEAFLGPRPKGMLVLHGDGDPKNNRVANLRYGTQKENMWDSIKHGTRPRGRAHKCAKLTEQQVRKIRASKLTNVALAAEFKVAPSTIRLARIGRTWGHV